MRPALARALARAQDYASAQDLCLRSGRPAPPAIQKIPPPAAAKAPAIEDSGLFGLVAGFHAAAMVGRSPALLPPLPQQRERAPLPVPHAVVERETRIIAETEAAPNQMKAGTRRKRQNYTFIEGQRYRLRYQRWDFQ
jgi:hypothetical protein